MKPSWWLSGANLARAVGKYRARLLAESPEVPEELVRGDTPDFSS